MPSRWAELLLLVRSVQLVDNVKLVSDSAAAFGGASVSPLSRQPQDILPAALDVHGRSTGTPNPAGRSPLRSPELHATALSDRSPDPVRPQNALQGGHAAAGSRMRAILFASGRTTGVIVPADPAPESSPVRTRAGACRRPRPTCRRGRPCRSVPARACSGVRQGSGGRAPRCGRVPHGTQPGAPRGLPRLWPGLRGASTRGSQEATERRAQRQRGWESLPIRSHSRPSGLSTPFSPVKGAHHARLAQVPSSVIQSVTAGPARYSFTAISGCGGRCADQRPSGPPRKPDGHRGRGPHKATRRGS